MLLGSALVWVLFCADGEIDLYVVRGSWCLRRVGWKNGRGCGSIIYIRNNDG